MRNKESFLKELQSGIAVLAETEQRDILAEYAQHIDMRVAGGVTEEEAIGDFGDVEKLTAEILEAYHVDPAYGKGAAARALPRLPDPRPALKSWLDRAQSFFHALGRRIAGGWARVCRWAARTRARLAGWAGGWRERLPLRGVQPRAEEDEKREESEAVETMEKREGAASGGGGLLRRLGRGLFRICRAAVRLVWNGALLVCAVPFAGLGMAALVCLGLLVVLLVQGYPLAGAVLCCLGGLSCCVGILGLGSGLVWRRAPRPAGDVPAEGLMERPAEEERGTDDERE